MWNAWCTVFKKMEKEFIPVDSSEAFCARFFSDSSPTSLNSIPIQFTEGTDTQQLFSTQFTPAMSQFQLNWDSLTRQLDSTLGTSESKTWNMVCYSAVKVNYYTYDILTLWKHHYHGIHSHTVPAILRFVCFFLLGGQREKVKQIGFSSAVIWPCTLS